MLGLKLNDINKRGPGEQPQNQNVPKVHLLLSFGRQEPLFTNMNQC